MLRPSGVRVPYMITFNPNQFSKPRTNKNSKIPCLHEFITLVQSIQTMRGTQECNENYKAFKKCIEKYM